MDYEATNKSKSKVSFHEDTHTDDEAKQREEHRVQTLFVYEQIKRVARRSCLPIFDQLNFDALFQLLHGYTWFDT